MVLNEVFQSLRASGVVKSEREFSQVWLGRSECYLRTLRFQGLEPSPSTVAMCASKLQHYGQTLIVSGGQEGLGMRIVALADQCHAHVNQ
jgi:hypothetical protein